MYVCGDFNGRCGDLDDFIRGVDCIHVPDREIIEFDLNQYGKLSIDFLINTNMCFWMVEERTMILYQFPQMARQSLITVFFSLKSR